MTISYNSIDSRIEETLKDIANTIQIEDNFSITHSQYDPVELPDEMQQRLRQMPESVLDKYLQVKLQTLIHDRYHYCSPITQETSIIENHATKWSKSKFYHQLCTNNHCKDRFESGWLVIEKTEEFLLVRKNDLTLHIISDRHLPTQQQNAQIGDVVAIRMPPQLVEPGYYIAVGSRGSINDLLDTIIVDIYCHVSSDGAIALMDRLTTQIDRMAIPFHFKVLYHPDTYQWCDAAVLSVTRNDYTQIQSILTNVYRETQSYFQSEIPLFMKRLADGVGIAERILAKNSSSATFAQYCSQLIAEGLVNAWKADRQTPEIKLKHIYDRFNETQIDLTQPYLNPGLEDIYTLDFCSK